MDIMYGWAIKWLGSSGLLSLILIMLSNITGFTLKFTHLVTLINKKQACMWASKQLCPKRVSTYSPSMCVCIYVCMHMYGAIVQELTGRRAVSPFQSDPASLLSCVMWICYDTLCGHAKLNRGSRRRSHTYLSCDFHCFIYARMCIIQDKRACARMHTHTHTDIYLYSNSKNVVSE